jgi:hypothetical protein
MTVSQGLVTLNPGNVFGPLQDISEAVEYYPAVPTPSYLPASTASSNIGNSGGLIS